MGWFDEQIKERKKRDDKKLSEALEEISSVITKKKTDTEGGSTETATSEKITKAIYRILRYYHIKQEECPPDVVSLDDQLEYFCRPHGIMRRTVVLEKGWYRNCAGAMLGIKKDGSIVALIPNRFSGYSYYDEAAGKMVRLNSRNEKDFISKAICFYYPLPQKKLSVIDLLLYVLKSIPVSSYVMIVFVLLVTTLVGMITPYVTHAIYNQVIPEGNMRLFWAMVVFTTSVSIGTLLINMSRTLIDQKVSTQLSVCVQAATMARVMSLPPDFFRQYSAGELTTKIQYFNALCADFYSGFIATGMTSVFSLVYIRQVFEYSPALLLPSILFTVLTLGYSVVNTILRIKTTKKAMEASAKKNGMTYAMISGIQKIRITGSEKRSFTRWTKTYTEEVKHTYGVPKILLLSSTISLAISLASTIVMYYIAVRAGVSVANYYAFTAAYGMLASAFASLVAMGMQSANIRPALEQVKPIMETVPETSADKKMVTQLSGDIELTNISFRYENNLPWVLNDISLKIKPGEYIAIVGKSGCGKSTLVRLLLGFEKAEKGSVYYDRKNIDALDLKSLRRKIGVVTQDDKLFYGDIFSNITISAPWLTLKEAWEAAEIADIADDIRAMPMGMHTVIAEGSGGISGGQKQRIAIARAVASKPKILIFDEATSALDNITQKKVSEALDKLNCTRIVVAHRLSTVKHCDRIIVLDNGNIVEDGTYDELLEKDGFFAELAKRQQVK